jgi:hypothetical protein
MAKRMRDRSRREKILKASIEVNVPTAAKDTITKITAAKVSVTFEE